MADREEGLVFNLAFGTRPYPQVTRPVRISGKVSKLQASFLGSGEGAPLPTKQRAGIQPGEQQASRARLAAPRVQAGSAPLRPGITARNQFRSRDPLRSWARGAHVTLSGGPGAHAWRARWGSGETSGRPSRLLPGHGLHPPRRYFEHPGSGCLILCLLYQDAHGDYPPGRRRDPADAMFPPQDQGLGVGTQPPAPQAPGDAQSRAGASLPAPGVRRAGRQAGDQVPRTCARPPHPGGPASRPSALTSELAGAQPRGAAAGAGWARETRSRAGRWEPRWRAGAASSSRAAAEALLSSCCRRRRGCGSQSYAAAVRP